MPENAPATQPWTVKRLLDWTRSYLEERGVESPRLCSELLLADAMKCRRIELYTRYEQTPSESVLSAFRDSIRQAGGGKPVAYLTGVKEFFSLEFEVTPAVLIPRPETEVLVERTITLVRALTGAFPRRPAADPEAAAGQVGAPAAETNGGVPAAPAQPTVRILDLCTGSGCIAVSLAKNLLNAGLFASDLSPDALAVARRNAARHGVAARVELREGDLLAPWREAAPFDIIVVNPPYIGRDEADSLASGVRDFEPHLALFAGDDGLAILRRLAVEALPALVPGGHLLTEVSWTQAAAVRALLENAGWGDIVTYQDDLRHERVVHARKPAAG